MKNLSEDLRLKLDALPNESGVYIMKRRDGQIIYIGKAKSLRDRVRSYFRTSGGDGRRQFKALVRNIADIDYIVTGNEQEALILEATQIRTHKPRYNILLKDDKKYPYIRITAEPFPRIFSTRDVVRDGSRYLGPYSNVRAMHTTLDMLRKVFPIRSCNAELPSDKVPLCLEYHIKRCEGPCENLVSADDYRKTVERAVRFLRGQNAEVIRELQKRMTEAAEDMRYEKAARFRDQIQALESMRARQKVVLDDQIDRDVLGMARSDDEACCSVLEIREGRLLGKKHHFLGGVMESSDGEILSAFARQFYLQNDFVPPEIHLPVQPEDADEVAAWLSQKADGKVELATPQRGAKAHMLDMAAKNATQMLAERQLKRELKRDRIPPIGLCPPARLTTSNAAPPHRRHRHLHLPRREPSRLSGLLYRRPGQAQPVPLLQNPRPRPARRLRRHPPSGPSPLPRPSRAQRAAARSAAHRRRAGPTRQRSRRPARTRHRRPTRRRPRQAL